MIGTIFWISVRRLLNNSQELVLVLVVPIMFFSIFALIFSRGVGGSQSPLSIAIVDDDQSALSRRVVQLMREQDAFKSVTGGKPLPSGWSEQRLSRGLLSQTDTDLVVHIPHGFGATASAALGGQVPLGEPNATEIRILDEGTSPVGQQIVQAILGQAVAAGVLHEIPQPGSSIASAETPGVILASATTASAAAPPQPKLEFQSENVFAYNKHHPKIAMYAAGIAVMFLLFSATGAGGSLLEEREAGTLERLLSSQLTITQLLCGKWLYITCLGSMQLLVMFAWGQVVFGVDLLGHLPGFFAMAIPTAAAASSLALLLAVLCKSRAQLNGISVIVVLSMSALGGSMIPRYIMSDSMQRLGKLTFNGWALDGFKKVFWYDLPPQAITTEVAVLCGLALLLGVFASVFASRWSATQ
ncbi:MAG: ABC transporter permease [Aureliella sp.]